MFPKTCTKITWIAGLTSNSGSQVPSETFRMITSGALEFCILTSSWRTALHIKFDRHSCYPAEMLLTGLLTLEVLSTLRLTQTSGGTVTAGLVPDIPTADGSPKLVWLQEAPVSVLNQIWKQTHSLSYQSTKTGAGRSQLNIRNDCVNDWELPAKLSGGDG